MILVFPNFEALQLAIVSATVPEEILRHPARSGNENELIYVQSECKLSRPAAESLKQLGIKSIRKAKVKLAREVTCWHQLIPLQRDADSEVIAERTPVLFVTRNEQQLVDLASEMMRLGNDRQSFRYLTDKKTHSTALLRVISPPYYTLLRAINPLVSGEKGVKESSTVATAEHSVAFVEQAGRVWVQFGYKHPLQDQIQAPVGQSVLIQSNGDWEFVDDVPYQDIYKTLETRLPEAPSELVDQPLSKPIEITLRMASAGVTDPAELWVIHEDALGQVESLIANADDKLLSRLSFAVAEPGEPSEAGESTESGDSTRVILRVRPSKQAPPVLVLKAVAMRSYLKLPNLFLPVGKRVHPPLRRDAVAELLAKDKNQITWLYPDPSDETGRSFLTERIDDSAFQPLSNWVEYVMDREAKSLKAWSDSFQFEFESFVCDEDKPKRPKPKRAPKESKRKQSVKEKGTKYSSTKTKDGADETETNETNELQFELTPSKMEKSETQLQLQQLEAQFSELEEPVDGPARREVWVQMAPLNAQLNRHQDSTICWSNAIWEDSNTEDCQQWLASEALVSSVANVQPKQLKKIISDQSTRPAEGTLIASYLAVAAQQENAPPFVVANLGAIAEFLQRQEQYMPIRTAWLAWYSLYKLSDGDVLGLARARDRILERLFQNGLTPEFDMPSFLRVKGVSGDDRNRLFGQQIKAIGERVENWVVDPAGVGSTATTREYAKLYFAFGLARLGDSAAATSLMESACDTIVGKRDPIHSWLAEAFVERIGAVLNSEPQQGSFSEDLMTRAESMERMDRFKIDRLRQQSRVLEPLERVDPFVRWHQRYADELAKRLSELPEITDREQLKSEIRDLLKAHEGKTKEHSRVLTAALQIAPRTGEEFAGSLVDSVLKTVQQSKDALEKALLMQKAMFVSAHYGRIDAVASLVAEFENSLPKIVEEYLQIQVLHNPTSKETVDTIELLFTESFQGLRKLGMRDEIGRIYSKVADLVKTKNPKGAKKRVARNSKVEIDATRPWRLLLCVAGGWYYFGQNEDANKIADSVRNILFESKLERVEQKNLMCAYIKAVAMAQPEHAQQRISELFQLDADGKPAVANIKDNMTTSSHYSISQLAVVETTVLALVSDELSLDSESKRWLDEDEFLVRSRIHRDVKMATQ